MIPAKRSYRRKKQRESLSKEQIQERALKVAIRQMFDLCFLPCVKWTRMEVSNGRGDHIGMLQQIQLKKEGMRTGWPDIMIFWPGLYGTRILQIEVKLPGEKLTPVQEALHKELLEIGIPTKVVHTVEEAYKALHDHNVPIKDLIIT